MVLGSTSFFSSSVGSVPFTRRIVALTTWPRTGSGAAETPRLARRRRVPQSALPQPVSEIVKWSPSG